MLGQFMEDVRRRSNRIGCVKDRLTGLNRGSNTSQGKSLVAGDLAVFSWRQGSRRNMITFVKQFGGDAIVVTRLQRHHVRFDDFFTFFEFLLNPVPRVVDRPVKKPLNHPECKKILATPSFTMRKT